MNTLVRSKKPVRLILLASIFLALLFATLPSQAESQDKIKVFVLAGQENMKGYGLVSDRKAASGDANTGTLQSMLADSNQASALSVLTDSSGEWHVRNDVWVVNKGRLRPLSVGLGATSKHIGPEFGFGHKVGEHFEETVLLIKVALDNKSLDKHFRPPSSGGKLGRSYKKLTNQIRSALDNIDQFFPDYDGQGYELEGFVWHQGWSDRSRENATNAYRTNAVNLINDLRDEFNSEFPVVIATTGMGGWEETDPRAISLLEAQLSIPQDDALIHGNVSVVDTRSFWLDPSVSPKDNKRLWNHNGETMFAMGDALGQSMIELISLQEDLPLDPTIDNDSAANDVLIPDAPEVASESSPFAKQEQSISASVTSSNDPVQRLVLGGGGGNPANAIPGVYYEYFEGNWSSLPDFSALTSRGSGSLDNISLNPRQVNDYFGFRYTGFIDVPLDGEYTFYTASDDGSRLFVGGQLVVENDGLHAKRERSGNISLVAGKHEFELEFFERTGQEVLELRYAGPSLSKRLIPNSALSYDPSFGGRPESELEGIFSELKQHIVGSRSLSATEIDAHKLRIDQLKNEFDSDVSTIHASMDLVRTYEAELGPLWVSRGDFVRSSVQNDIHWTIFHVMQYIIDVVYNNENLEQYAYLIDGFKFESSAKFPGAVEPPSNPDNVYRVDIQGTYKDTFGRPVMGEEFARKPTGAYVAPGSIATVKVPASMVNSKFKLRVGAHSWDYSNRPRAKRLDRVSVVYPITQTEMKVANPLGGGIYLEIEEGGDAGIVTLEIQNTVRSPFFSAKDFHRTTLAEWRNTERHHPAPWADFQSEKTMFQVPTSWIYNYDDPVSLMERWDQAFDVTNKLMGYPIERGKETFYTQADVMLRVGAFNPGYPSVNTGTDPSHDYGGNHNHALLNGPETAPDYLFHEEGHGYLFVKYGGEMESAVNLLHAAVANRAFGVGLDKALRDSRGTNNEYHTLDTTAMTWMTSLSFKANNPMHQLEKQYQLKGHAKYIDIARLFGWDVIDDFYYSVNEDYEAGNDWDRHGTPYDVITLRLSEKAGVDLMPLLHFWGIHPEDYSSLKQQMNSAGLRRSHEIYDTLQHYKSLAPKNNAEFREFALAWWGRQPNPNGFWTESEHGRQWDNSQGVIYNEATHAGVVAQIDMLLQTYFPQGRPTDPSQKYRLTVENGLGSGDYAPGAQVSISADAALGGVMFDKWVLEQGNAAIENINTPSTTLTMGGSNTVVAATYRSRPTNPDSNIKITSDNQYELYVDGHLIGTGTNWKEAQVYSDIARLNENSVIAVKAFNTGGPAGLIAEINMSGQQYVTDASWKTSLSGPSGWNDPAFNDDSWVPAKDLGAFNVGPWGGRVQNMSSDTPARWIWSPQESNTVYLRLDLGSGNDGGPGDGGGREIPAQLPDPDSSAPASDKPVKVYILSGQSNMVGMGEVGPLGTPGTLETLTKNQGMFQHVIDDNGEWNVRNDVWYKGVITARGNKWLAPGTGANGNVIGPEFQFGHIMGYYHDEPVIILKVSQGNRSLAWDILPPGSERYTVDGRTYAGYGDGDDSWSDDDPYTDIQTWYAGKQYDDFVREAKAVLDNFGANFPQFASQGYEIAGFGWFQGHKDTGNSVHASRYEQNLVRFIETFRNDLGASDAPFVISTIGFHGNAMSGNALTVAEAQLAVSGESGKYPQFADQVKTVDSRDYWRTVAQSPANQDYHYNRNAETFMMVGDAMGRAMVDLLNGNSGGNENFREPENPAETLSGLDYRYYHGEWDVIPNFESLSPIESGTIGNFDTAPKRQNDRFGFNYQGFIDIPTSGTYTFFTTSDDGSKLYIGDSLVVDNDGLHPMIERSGTIGLKAGKHAIRVDFFEKTGGEGLEVKYQRAGSDKINIANSQLYRLDPDSGSGLRAPENPQHTTSGLEFRYFHGEWNQIPDFDNMTPVESGAILNFDTYFATQNDRFGFSYDGYIEVQRDGDYTFYTSSDDGSKLYIGNELVVDNDGLHGMRERSGVIGLRAGKHAIRVEFFEKTGGEGLNVSYEGPSLGKTQIPDAVLFRDSSTSAGFRQPENPANAVNGIDFAYYHGEWNQLPDFSTLNMSAQGYGRNFDISGRLQDQHFAYSFTGYIDVPNDEEYTFYTRSDDGSKLYIGDTLVVDNDGLHPMQERNGKIGLLKGKHAIRVDFFEKTGGEGLSVSISAPGMAKETIPDSALYKVW